MKAPKDFDLIITSKIWKNDFNELIDYDNKNFEKKVFKINSSGIISRIDNEIIFSKEKNGSNKLLEIIKNEENFKYNINCGNWSQDLISLSNEKAAYLLYKTDFYKDENLMKNKFYRLCQGDIFKLGKIYIKLLDMQLGYEETEIEKSENFISSNDNNTMKRNASFNSTILKGQKVIKGSFLSDNNQKEKYFDLSNSKDHSNNNMSNNSQIKNKFFLPRIKSSEELFMPKPKIKLKSEQEEETSIKNKKLKKIKNIKKKKNACRICYGENSIKENPLICPCTCKGSMKYIHFLCLKNWLNSKIESEIEQNSDENSTISYNKKDICCELCKSQFPDYIRYKGILYNISFYKPKFKEFIIFETLREDKNKNNYINIVSLDNKKVINIGRSRDCDFSIPEISISRFHCIIHKNNGALYIEDNNSKFGTLILVQNDNIEMNNNIPLKLQIDSTYIKIKMNIPTHFSCCNVNTNNTNTNYVDKIDYQIQNKKYLNVFSYFYIKDNNNIDLDLEISKDGKLKSSDNSNNLIDEIKISNDEKVKSSDDSNNLIDEIKISNDEKVKSSDDSNNIIDVSKQNKNDSEINNMKEKKSLIDSEKEKASEENDYELFLDIKEESNSNPNIKKNEGNKRNNLQVNNIDILNNMQIYKNKLDIIRNYNTNNNISSFSRTGIADSNCNITLFKKNNMKIEECNNKNFLNKNEQDNKHSMAKLMKKIRITNSNSKNVKNKEEYILPNINKDSKPFGNNLKSPIKNNNIQLINSKFKPLNFNDKNADNNIFNLNNNNKKITINKHNIFNYNFFLNNNNKKISNSKNNSKLEDQRESLINMKESYFIEKGENNDN